MKRVASFISAARPGLEYLAFVLFVFTLAHLFPDAMLFGLRSGELVLVALVVASVQTGIRFMKERPKDYDDPS